MIQFYKTVRENCASNCGVRINAAITALIPAVDQAQQVLPSLHQYLPDNLYGTGFVVLAIANILLHIRIPPQP